MKRIVFDLETNGLYDEVTKAHCLVLRDLDSDAYISCADQPGYSTIEEGLRVLSGATLIIGHNVIKYDIPVLQKLFPGTSFDGIEILDTLVLTRFLFAHQTEEDYGLNRAGTLPGDLIGSHALKAWGYRIGLLKGIFAEDNDWSKWSEGMQRYCERDTLVTKTLFLQKVKPLLEANQRASDIEHKLAWYLAAQERNGVPFDIENAISLQGKLASERELLGLKLRETFGSWEAVDKVFTPKRDNKKLGYTKGVQVTKMKVVEFNPASRDHIAYILKTRYGWTPTELTDGGKAKIDEETLLGLTHIPECAMLQRYLLLNKRLGAISEGKQSWFQHARNDGLQGGVLTGMHHIHGSVNPNGAVTHRASHSFPNLAQVPNVGSEYGKDCRALFVVPPGWTLMGADASGLELRCLAHYMARHDNGDYGRILLTDDIHTANQIAAGLDTRDQSKTFIYAFLYGAGAEKIGSIVSPLASKEEQKKIGARLKKKFLKNTPALNALGNGVQNAVQSRGYITMPDGRRSYIRSAHAALNTLLQGAGAIICKQWIVNFDAAMTAEFGPQGWDGQWAALLWVHDEIQVAVRPEIADRAMAIAIAAIEKVTEQLEWRIPLTGEAKLGANWSETH